MLCCARHMSNGLHVPAPAPRHSELRAPVLGQTILALHARHGTRCTCLSMHRNHLRQDTAQLVDRAGIGGAHCRIDSWRSHRSESDSFSGIGRFTPPTHSENGPSRSNHGCSERSGVSLLQALATPRLCVCMYTLQEVMYAAGPASSRRCEGAVTRRQPL